MEVQENLTKKIILSVCIFAYNHEQYIEQAIESVLYQKTNFEFEILIGEDGSNDKTPEILERYNKFYPKRFKILYQDQTKKIYINHHPTGRYNFINTLKNCNGKYIALLDGDDYWTDPYKLQKQVDFLEANEEYVMCFHEVSIKSEIKNQIIGKYSNLNKFDITTEDLFNRHIIATCSILFKKSAYDNKSLTERIASGDKLLIFMLSLKGKIRFLQDCMSVYRLHPGGISNTHIGIKKVYDMSTYLNHIDVLTNYNYHELCKSSLLHEIETHIVPLYVNKKEKNISEFSKNEIIKELAKRIRSKFKF